MSMQSESPQKGVDIRTGKDSGGSKRSVTSGGGRRWIMGLLLGYTIMSLMVFKVASSAALYHKHQESGNAIASSAEEPATATEAATSGDDSDSDIEKMRAKLQQLQHEQQQQYLRQQQQQLQLHLQQMQQTAGGGLSAGETAYLLERADNSIAPIYGTWGTKARRPLHATSSLESDDAHVYERLPKRSATMTPLRGLVPRDQMPRPPRLATQDMQLSLGSPSPPPPPTTALLRRQFSETPGTRAQREEGGFKPKPFHFPYDGPMPEQFSKGEARPELNNIQDILQHLHISGVAPSKLPPMVMMPTGLHIAGTYKNLKASGIGNFFRGKRNKKQMQFSIPFPMSPLGHHISGPMTLPMMMPLPMQWYPPGVLPHQRVAIDQLYPYKPRSPQDVNLLAMQPLASNKPVSKKKKKKQQQQQQQQLLEHGSQQQQHFVSDPFGQPVFAINATRQPKHTRIPFKVNLDIYPVMPPSRPASVMHRHPFQQQDYAFPSAAALTGTTAAAFQMPGGHGIYQTPFKFPSQSAMVFPDQATRYSQQYQQAQKYPPPPKSIQPEESIYGQQQQQQQGLGQVESHNSPIMLHLNVFPKQKPTASVRVSTNPFHNHNMRNTIQSNDLPPPHPPSPIEPRNVITGNTTQLQQQHQHQQHQQLQPLNQTQQQLQPQAPGNRSSSISRSDHLPLIDFEHPIVAAELPDPASLTSNIRHSPQDYVRYRKTPMDEHYRHQKSANIEQLAAEAQTASLFRFPVEDLIQFQVDDAL
nr:histone-lysine N-methyltransferase 2D [Drosophila bipectinata]